MGPKTARVLFRIWCGFVVLLAVGGSLWGLWAWWQAEQRAKYPPPPERKSDMRGRVTAAKKAGDFTEITIEEPTVGGVWRAFASAGPDTQVRTRDPLRSELDVDQVVQVWYRADPKPGERGRAAEYILVEGYKLQWQK